MDPPDGGRERTTAAMLSLAFLSILGLAALDWMGDAEGSTGLRHRVLEGLVACVALVGAVGMGVRLLRLGAATRELSRRARGLEADLLRSRADAERFRREASDLIAGLGTAIDRQLDQWELSPAEKDVAMLLLKGLSHREIAEVRGVSEATVRQQARAMYRKAGLSGRADLAAFFLEDLLGPRA